MIWENGIETCIISYKKRIASPGLMHDTGCLGLVHWDDVEGWDGLGRKVGGVFRMGNNCTPMVDSCQCMAKPIQYYKVKKKTLEKNFRHRRDTSHYTEQFTHLKNSV